jgi:hypothetical protein
MAMSSDGQYLASATYGLGAKVYVWNLEAVLKRARGITVRVYILESVSFLNDFVHRSGRCTVEREAQGEFFLLFFHASSDFSIRDMQLNPEMCGSQLRIT